MKKIQLFFLLMCCVATGLKAQSAAKDTSSVVRRAQMMLNVNSLGYNPKKAIAMIASEAEKGNAAAMNALGIVYSKGMGTAIEPVQAISWFEKAGQTGYAQAWYNLGLIYKNGSDVPQDFVKAVSCFSKGSKLNSTASTYSLGYMTYKGLGCKQSYEEAITMFRKAIIKGSLGSMYMLGLCFRNGYGVKLNVDSGRYWIEKAASKGYRFAKEEMQEEQAENPALAKSHQGETLTSANAVEKVGNQEFPKIDHQIDADHIAGTYLGDIIRYDWSGKNVIGKSKLKLTLNGKGGSYSGEWAEDNSIPTTIQGQLLDTAFTFSNSQYERVDHYSAKKPSTFEFRNAHLKMIKIGDSVFFVGTIQQFSLRQNEPEKPIYISLLKESDVSKNVAIGKDLEGKDATQIISNIIAYPNPFSSSFQVSFSLKTSKQVTIYLTDLMGQTIYFKKQDLLAGEQNLQISVNAPRGTYVLKVQIGKEVHSTVLIKQ